MPNYTLHTWGPSKIEWSELDLSVIDNSRNAVPAVRSIGCPSLGASGSSIPRRPPAHRRTTSFKR